MSPSTALPPRPLFPAASGSSSHRLLATFSPSYTLHPFQSCFLFVRIYHGNNTDEKSCPMFGIAVAVTGAVSRCPVAESLRLSCLCVGSSIAITLWVAHAFPQPGGGHRPGPDRLPQHGAPLLLLHGPHRALQVHRHHLLRRAPRAQHRPRGRRCAGAHAPMPVSGRDCFPHLFVAKGLKSGPVDPGKL